MPIKEKPIIAISAPITIAAAENDAEGKPKGPREFTADFYKGGALEIEGWALPIVVDLSGLDVGNVLVANLDHDPSKRVGNFTVENDGKQLIAHGKANAANPARDEVVNSAIEGYQWQASLEVRPKKGGIEEVKAGKQVTVNGQTFKGPLYVTRQGVLKGFAFVTHGADDATSASIAASAFPPKESTMTPELKTFIEAMLPGTDIGNLSDETIANLKANYEGQNGKKPSATVDLGTGIKAKREENDRIRAITEMALEACDKRPFAIDGIKGLAEQGIEGKWTLDKFRLELLEATTVPDPATIFSPRDNRLKNNVVEAAICMTGGLEDIEKKFDERILQQAHDRFPHGIGLKELFVLAAEENGHRTKGYNVDIHVQRAAFGMTGPRSAIQGSGHFSTFSLPNTVANSANKFLREGWMSIDQTPLELSARRSVRDFKTITTVSLTGGFTFEKVAAGGEIPHATPGELAYTNKVDTYGKMCAITFEDITNDDLGALTAIPRRIGRGGMLMLNHIFWTEFLNNGSFFTSGNANVSTDTGALGLTGLAQAEAIFMAQTDPDGLPLAAMPKILLVPTALRATAAELMTSSMVVTGSDLVRPSANIWQGRFRVVSSPYMSNSSYTGYSATAWYLLADPSDIPVIEIAALNGRIEPTVDSADADFNVLGIQMRGYSHVGVNLQEYRGGVRADGSAAG
jgi:hypothetical protein